MSTAASPDVVMHPLYAARKMLGRMDRMRDAYVDFDAAATLAGTPAVFAEMVRIMRKEGAVLACGASRKGGFQWAPMPENVLATVDLAAFRRHGGVRAMKGPVSDAGGMWLDGEKFVVPVFRKDMAVIRSYAPFESDDEAVSYSVWLVMSLLNMMLAMPLVILGIGSNHSFDPIAQRK